MTGLGRLHVRSFAAPRICIARRPRRPWSHRDAGQRTGWRCAPGGGRALRRRLLTCSAAAGVEAASPHRGLRATITVRPPSRSGSTSFCKLLADRLEVPPREESRAPPARQCWRDRRWDRLSTRGSRAPRRAQGAALRVNAATDEDETEGILPLFPLCHHPPPPIEIALHFHQYSRIVVI